jgi:intron-binding protein aquarius
MKSRGPYPENAVSQNTVRFTPVQVEAIRSGMRTGLSLIVGPCGTGKTDVAVQLISNLYHSAPSERILIITHSNAALNDIFEKILYKDIHPRHLLRLGSGEIGLKESRSSSSSSFSRVNSFETMYSKQGRVDWCLMKRLQILGQVQRLSLSLGLLGDVGSSCETASYFYNFTVLPKIQQFWKEYKEMQENISVKKLKEIFPFSAFFNDVPSLFSSTVDNDSVINEETLDGIHSCLNYLYNMFNELNDYRMLEILRTQSLRSNYILTQQVSSIPLDNVCFSMLFAMMILIIFLIPLVGKILLSL